MFFEGQQLLRQWLEGAGDAKTVDLGAIVPIGTIEATGGGVDVSLSLDGESFEPVQNDDGGGATARYVRVALRQGGSAVVAVHAGAGYVATPDPYWSDSFKRYEGWTGSDGIYSFNITDGKDTANNTDDKRTLFFFGDTLVSQVDRETLRRVGPLFMPNNSYALLDGEDPQQPGAMSFHYATDGAGKPAGVIKPTRECFDFEGRGESFEKSYFWLQDGVVLGNKLYCMPSIITEDLSQPEGFQFRGLGVTIAEVDIVDGTPDFPTARLHPTELWAINDELSILYGASMLPYLRQAGHEAGDGYVYVYGHMSFKSTGRRSLCVARVLPDRFADWTQWRFYDGEGFGADIWQSKPLLDHVSCEMSVSPIAAGKHKGRMLAVFQYDTKSEYMAYAIGDGPCGPFTAPRKVYRCEEGDLHPSVYTYNAKAHPHLSSPERILATYNVNSTSFEQHERNGHIYRPRFVRLDDTTVTAWDRLFADAFAGRTAWFRTLNRLAAPGGTVFVGDSITNEFPAEEMLAEYLPVYNRGIGGDTTAGVLTRMEESIFELRPSKLFLLIGTNDPVFLPNGTQHTADNIARIIGQVQQRLPQCEVHLISILPVNDSAHPKISPETVGCRDNGAINAINARLRQLAGEFGVTYVDMHGHLADENGRLRLEYTREGLHLSPRGYGAFVDHIKTYLQ